MVRLHLINTEYVFYHLCPTGGWNYVIRHLADSLQRLEARIEREEMENRCEVFKDADVYIDTFLDKTFLWDANAKKNIYTNPWLGVIHHPPNLANSCNVLLMKEGFRKSLPTCIGLVVLSEYLAESIMDFISKNREIFPRFPQVHVLKHPLPKLLSQPSESPFARRKRILIHVGQHGRNYENFFHLSCPLFNKYFLTNDYFLPNHVCGPAPITGMPSEMEEEPGSSSARKRIRDKIKTWIKKTIQKSQGELDRLVEHRRWNICNILLRPFHPLPNPIPPSVISTSMDVDGSIIFPPGCIHQKCTALRRMETHSYLDVLAQSIVYIHLDDASAVNTVLECIALKTPLIINRHPAVVEVLGKEYPLYADTVEDAAVMLESGDLSIFHSTSLYMLERLNLKEHTLANFEDGMIRIFSKVMWQKNMEDVRQDIELMPPCDLLPAGGIQYVDAMARFACYAQRRENIALTRDINTEYVMPTHETSDDSHDSNGSFCIV